jgi:hypothetical protein
MVNNRGIIIHKTDHKKGCRHDYVISIKIESSYNFKRGCYNVFDLGYLLV